MGKDSKIEWTDHTFNPWIGCRRVSPGCDRCYAELYARRTGQGELWADKRRRTGESNWREPLKWDAEARAAGVRRRVFCASLADVFDNAADPEWRRDLLLLIGQTPNLDWLLLTKRIGNAREMLEQAIVDLNAIASGLPTWAEQPWQNVWIGATVVNQEEAARDIPKLLHVPAVKRFLSIEPMLGVIDLRRAGAFRDIWWDTTPGSGGRPPVSKGVDWVIAGGESQHGARPMHPDWIRSIRDQCAENRQEFRGGTPFLFKQWGEWRPPEPDEYFSTARGQAQRTPAFIVATDGTVHCFDSQYTQGGKPMLRVGKAKAGRLLDGVQHDGFP